MTIRFFKVRPFLLLLIALALPSATGAQETPGQTPAETPVGKELVVATKVIAPFAMKGADGKWSGLSIELWRRVAERLKLKYRFVEADLPEIIDGVATKKFDVGIAAITITQAREARLDFTHSYHATGLGIATRVESASIWDIAGRFLSISFLAVVGVLAGVLLFVGVLLWLFERKKNKEQFGGGTARGIGSGFWLSAVTMTTVGYGDKAPSTLGGRIVTLIWMFTALILISTFTGAIASSLTLGRLEGSVKGIDDLPTVRVAAIAGTTSIDWLSEERIRHRTFRTVDEALKALAEDQVDAVVYDASVLRYLVEVGWKEKLLVLPGIFAPQDYGIALQPGSDLRERLNVALLAETQTRWWRSQIFRYLGKK